MEMSKGEFASHIGRSAACVSQYIRDGVIGADALVGEGRYARILVDVAKRQIATRRDVGQSLGNGLLTRVSGGADTPPTVGLRGEPDTAEKIQLERLEWERRKNRQAQIEEARSAGLLVPVEDMRRALVGGLQTVVDVFTGMAPDLANEIAAVSNMPQRDVVHLVNKVITARRAIAAKAIREATAQLPETVEGVVS